MNELQKVFNYEDHQVRKKEIPCVRIRRRVFFRREAIERWMAEKEVVRG